MKRNITITKTILSLIAVTLMLSSCSSWHYKYPRVRIDSESTTYAIKEESPKELVATTQVEPMENNTLHYPVYENSHLDSSYNENVTDKKSTVSANKSHLKSKVPFRLVAEPMKKIEDQISHAKSVEKAALSGWVRIMVILFVVGFILLLIGIFLSVFIFGGFWWLFWTVGALCILAGFIVLILGLVGLI